MWLMVLHPSWQLGTRTRWSFVGKERAVVLLEYLTSAGPEVLVQGKPGLAAAVKGPRCVGAELGAATPPLIALIHI